MPKGDARLDDADIARIAAWIERGAPYERPLTAGEPRAPGDDERRFWSFLPLAPVAVPAVVDAAWPRTPIDQFVLARLEQEGIAPSAAADRRTLLRRVALDLTGLPPGEGEIEAFVNDASPDAFAHVVDRLLASPHYGERWARHWLDAARFAESHGFEQDYDRPHAYWYRDFVIRSFNADLPYDQFVRWQIAGDEIAPDDPWALAATGFLGACVFPTQLTEAEFESARYDELDDMLKTTGVAMLGLTIGCARCHDHKYDPISSREYYRMLATFTTAVRSEVEVEFDQDARRAASALWSAAHAPLQESLAAFERDQLPARFASWLQHPGGTRIAAPDWIVLDVAESRSSGGACFTPQDDGSLLVSGPNADFDTYTLVADTSLDHIRALRLEALADRSLVAGGPGRADNGNLAPTRVMVRAAPRSCPERAVAVTLTQPRATFEQSARLAAANLIDDDAASAWAVDPQFGRDHAVAFAIDPPVGFAGGTTLTITIEHHNNVRHNIGRVRLAVSARPPPLELASSAMRESLAQASAAWQLGLQLAPAQLGALARWYRPADPLWQARHAAVQDHAALEPRPHVETIMITSEGVKPMPHHADERGFPHCYDATYFLKRGNVQQKGEVATPGFLEVLSRAPEGERHWQQAPPAGSRTSWRRRALASWLTDSACGAGDLLARVIVNRLWQHHFGRGLVATPNDFGKQGERPSHPELLDWLAAELKQDGWRLKPIQRLIVTSAVYQQSSAVDQDRLQRDADNRWLWHWQPRRLEAEVIRDAMLKVSGLLDERMYGPGTLDPDMRRRSIYFFVKRSEAVPFLALFDLPEPTVSVGCRVTTTIAPQALALMNGAEVRALAAALGAQLASAASNSLDAAAARGYQLVLGRLPTGTEQQFATQFLARQSQLHAADGRSDHLALALTDFAQVLFSLNEFVYVE
ncbi:MAG: DUF1549 and DUF1553 domain-containing protein [Planctomycetota bacterium]